uniref:Phosphate-selective porin O and P n=1 Tax=Solibacter usitatus (strain Ellin6076) TaxID=234267 RepID=Q025K4_SOLUE
MRIQHVGVRSSAALVFFTSTTLFVSSAHAQGSSPTGPESVGPPVENGVVRELLRKIQEQQKSLDEQQKSIDEQQKSLAALIGELQRLLGRGTATNLAIDGKPIVPPTTASASAPRANAALNTPPAVTGSASTPVPPVSVVASQRNDDHYRDGMVILETREDAKVPFLLKFNVNSQVRYLNTQDSKGTFTDHLGVVSAVNTRNDITVNRSMFILSGYVFDKRALYSVTVWTSAGAASIVVAGNIGWRFNKALTLTGGYTGVPGSRSLVNTFPFFTASDRSMADNFFRPGFTQGVWASGEPVKGLNYLAFLGNGLNTLNISANKIDTFLAVSGSVWWEPLGPYGPLGKDRNMYDDYFASKKVRIRIGTSFTRSREDRFTNLEQSNPDNTSLYNSDGVLTFSTGAFAPSVTLSLATYRMWAVDGGIKWNGLAVNGQYFARLLNDFVADGPLPLKSTFDHGGEFSASYFAKPKKLMPYIRGSWVIGQFGNSYEYGAGAKWFPVRTDRLWLATEVFRVNKSPYSGVFTPYTLGLTGWVPMVQAFLAF